MKYLTFVALFFHSQVFADKLGTTTFKPSEVKQVEVSNSDGNVFFSSHKKDTILVKVTKERFNAKQCFERKSTKNKVLTLASGKLGYAGTRCVVNYDIQLPPALEIMVNIGSGKLTFKGEARKIKFRSGSGTVNLHGVLENVDGITGSGNISVDGVSGKTKLQAGVGTIRVVYNKDVVVKDSLHIRSSSGAVFVTGATGSAFLSSGTGDVNIQYAKVPEKGVVELRTGSGNSKVIVPMGSKIISDFRSGSGRIYNEVGDLRSSKFKVYFRSGSGNLDIIKVM